MSFLMRKCIPVYTLSPSTGFGRESFVSVLCLCRPDSRDCGSVVLVEEQDWTAPAGFNLGKQDVLVLFGPVDSPWFVKRAGRLLRHSVLLLLLPTSRSCATIFLISFRKFPHFLSNTSAFSPVIRLSCVYLFTFYSKVKHWTWQCWFLLLPLPLRST